MQPRVSIVLINYNDRKYMEELFAALHAQDYDNFNVIVVDNASGDDSVKWLKENEKEISLIELLCNVGFGEGCNIGIRYALDGGADFVLLLNMDTVPQPDMLRKLVESADENTVTTALTYQGESDDSYQLWYAGGEINKRTANAEQVLYPSWERDSYEVEFISGCCMLLHREIINRVGYFDKDYFLYYEDTDYCMRLKKASVRMRLLTTTSLWHKVGGSSLGGHEMSCSTQYYVTRNRLLFSEKQMDMFPQGNLSILREILRERGFFEDVLNEKYKPYVLAAIKDFFKGYFEKGYYGEILLKDKLFITDDFYEREETEGSFGYWARDQRARLYIVNPSRQSCIYHISFDLSSLSAAADQQITIEADNEPVGTFAVPGYIEFWKGMEGEQNTCIDFLFNGAPVLNEQDGDERPLCFELLNIHVDAERKEYCLIGREFYPEEKDGTDTWVWCSSPSGTVYFTDREAPGLQVSFSVFSEGAKKNESIRIFLNDKWICDGRYGERIKFEIENTEPKLYRLKIVSDREPYQVEGDSRQFVFRLNNLTITAIDDGTRG